ncbi:MAG: hypothetical protein MIO93_12600 [ANME-2 cluster archaeon]|nr:hypothetical protein [ANME-2 cluster archaeon]
MAICIKDYVFYHRAIKKPLPTHNRGVWSRSGQAHWENEGGEGAAGELMKGWNYQLIFSFGIEILNFMK